MRVAFEFVRNWVAIAALYIGWRKLAVKLTSEEHVAWVEGNGPFG